VVTRFAGDAIRWVVLVVGIVLVLVWLAMHVDG
jgi:hypothetical protein